MYYLNDLGRVDAAERARRKTAAVMKRQARQQARAAAVQKRQEARDTRQAAQQVKKEERQQAKLDRQEAKKAGVESSVLAPGFEPVDQGQVQTGFADPSGGGFDPPITVPMYYPGQQQPQYPMAPMGPLQQQYPAPGPMQYPAPGPMQYPAPGPMQYPAPGPAQFDESGAMESTGTDSQEMAEADQQETQVEETQEVSSEETDMQAGLEGLANLGKARRPKCQPQFGYPTLAKYRRACNKARKAQGVKWNQKACGCVDAYGRLVPAYPADMQPPTPYPPGACPAAYAVDPNTGQCVPIQPGQQCPPGSMLAMTPTGPQCQPLQQYVQPPYYGGGSFGPVSYGAGPQFDDPYGMAPGLPSVTGAGAPSYGSPFPSYAGAQPGGGAGPMFTAEVGIEAGEAGGEDIGLPADYVAYTGGVGPLPSTEGQAPMAQEQFSELEGDQPDSMSGLGYSRQMPHVIRRSRFLRQSYAGLYPAAQGIDLYPISGSNPLYPAAQGTEFYPDSEATGLDAGLGALYPAAQGTDLYPVSGTNPLYPAAQGTDFYPDSEACGLNPGLGAAMLKEESGVMGLAVTGVILYGLFKVFCKKA
jgi:hypothetical protein